MRTRHSLTLSGKADMALKPTIHSHFRSVDPILYTHVHLIDEMTLSISRTPFVDLIEGITSQQLSEKAGATIFGRLKKLFPSGRITPDRVLAIADQQLRDVGVSWSKAAYIKAIASAVKSKKISFKMLERLSDEEVIKALVQVKGVGRWTAEMFLMFSLGREDIFSYGDLGLRRGMQKIYGFKYEPTLKQMEKITSRWAPFRTYGARILWRYLDSGLMKS